ncbi:MAG: hypothetical protein WC719_02205 [Patescibacteria group bacterium]|jgi:putative hemolysin
MSRKKIIVSSSIILALLLLAGAYLYVCNKPSKAQGRILGATIIIPNKDGFEAKLTNIKGENLKGDIKDSQTGKKSGGEVIAYVDKMMNLSDDGSSFILPFELNYGEQEKYLYLGIFYLEPTDTSIIGKNNSPKIIKHPYSYLLGENITLEKINSFIPGPYSYTINLEYFNNEGVKNNLALRFYYEKSAFEVAKKCEEIGSVVKRERGDGKKYDICVLGDSHECTLEAYEKGNCPVEGYDVSMTDNPVKRWGIAQGFLFKNGNFIFQANYENCTIDDFYFDRCEMK